MGKYPLQHQVLGQCRSGQQMGFFGAALLGDGPTKGGILVIDDVTRGKLLKVEVPGSCKEPDYEVCTVVDIKPEQCSQFDVKVSLTNTTVNDVRAVEGHMRVDCTVGESGVFKGSIDFSTCH